MKFQNFASWSAILAGFSGLAYAYFFVIARNPFYSSIFLALGGLFAIKVAVYLYEVFKKEENGFAALGAVFLIAGSLGALVHGGYDLANTINPPAGINTDLPSQVDPRGLLAFGVTGLGILKFSWLMDKHKQFPGNLRLLGYLSGVLLVVIYLARLTVLDPANPWLLYPVLIEGFVVNPLWYIWLGSVMKRY